MKQIKLINPENVSDEEVKEYRTREAARAVVMDENKLVALLYVASEHYYKLPGGGIESSEDKRTALQRECKEEIGAEVEIIKDIGKIIEYRRIFDLKQISYCYLAKLKGNKGISNFTEEELAQGLKQIWLPFDQALEILSNNIATSAEGRDYIVPRDTTFLKSVENYFKE